MRTSIFVSLVMVAALSTPVAAHAQQFVVTTREFNDRQSGSDLTIATGFPISFAECSGASGVDPVRLSFRDFTISDPGATKVIDVWRGAVNGQCQTIANRTKNTGGDSPCRYIGAIGGVTAVPFDGEISASELFVDLCTEDREETYDFYFLLSDSAENRLTDIPWARLTISIDTRAPTAPSDLSTSPGDTQIRLSWSSPSGEIISGARAYVVVGGCEGGDGGTSELVEGQRPPEGTPSYNVSGNTLNGAAIGLDYGETAAVGVVLTDRAGNESVLSNIVCVQRIQLEGPLEDFCRDRGYAGSGGDVDVDACLDEYRCGISGAGLGASGRLVWITLAFGALLWVARRKRNL